MAEETLSKMNREIGETLVMVGSIKDMLDEHKEVHQDIKDILQRQDARLTRSEKSIIIMVVVMSLMLLVPPDALAETLKGLLKAVL